MDPGFHLGDPIVSAFNRLAAYWVRWERGAVGNVTESADQKSGHGQPCRKLMGRRQQQRAAHPADLPSVRAHVSATETSPCFPEGLRV